MFQLKHVLELRSETALLRAAPKLGQFAVGTTKSLRLFHAPSLTCIWTWKQTERIYPCETPFLLSNGKILTHGKRSPKICKSQGLSLFAKGLRRLTGFEVQSFATSQDGQFVALSGLNQELELWNFQMNKRLYKGRGGFHLREFHPHNACVVVESPSQAYAQIMELPSGRHLLDMPLPERLGGWGTGHQRLAFDRYGDTFWVLTGAGLLHVDWRKGKCRETKIEHESRSANLHHGGRVIKLQLDGILGLALSPKNQRMALAVNDKIQLYAINRQGNLSLEQTIEQKAFSMLFADEDHLAVVDYQSGPTERKLLVYGRGSR